MRSQWLASYVANRIYLLSLWHVVVDTDATASKVLEVMLKEKTLHYYIGNLTEVEREQKKKRKSLLKQQAAMDKRKVAIEKTIADGAKRARQTGDETLQKQVKSRQKKLDDRWGLERNEKGHRFVFRCRVIRFTHT